MLGAVGEAAAGARITLDQCYGKRGSSLLQQLRNQGGAGEPATNDRNGEF
jgi:hypothetical protein